MHRDIDTLLAHRRTAWLRVKRWTIPRIIDIKLTKSGVHYTVISSHLVSPRLDYDPLSETGADLAGNVARERLLVDAGDEGLGVRVFALVISRSASRARVDQTVVTGYVCVAVEQKEE